MSELATELSRRVDREHVKEFATEKAAELKERAKELATDKAVELKQHAKDAATDKAYEMKDRAREAVMTKTTQLKDRADTSKGWSLLGAILGAGVGASLMRKAFSVREDRYEGDGHLYGRGDDYDQNWRYGAYDRRDVRPYDVRTATGGVDAGDLSTSARVGDTSQGLSMSGDVGFENRGDVQIGADTGPSMKDKVSDVKERAVEMKDRVKDQAHELKERTMGRVREHVPHKDELKGRAYAARGQASDWFNRTLEEQPLLLALGGIAVGMLASSMLPVTSRERRLMQPAKSRVEERISDLGDRLTDKLRGEDHAGSDMGMSASPNMGVSSSNIGPGNTGISTGAASVNSDIGVSGLETDRSQDLSAPTGSRIPPLPPLDDLTKIH